jgi:uncharacterized protein YbjT (DUF2867 family)
MNKPTRPDILLAGSSGLIGTLVLERLLATAATGSARIFALVRRLLRADAPQLLQIVTAAGDQAPDAAIGQMLGQHQAQLGFYVCALGTTMARAGSQQAFAAVDHDLVLRLADIALHHGAEHAVVVSSVGADAASRNFYLRTKGRMERDLSSLGFRRCDFLHPGLLIGARTAEQRPGESIAQRLSPLFNPVLMGPLRRYRAITADVVAAAAVNLLRETTPGVYRHEYDDLGRSALQ